MRKFCNISMKVLAYVVLSTLSVSSSGSSFGEVPDGNSHQLWIVDTDSDLDSATTFADPGDIILVKPGTYTNVDVSDIDTDILLLSEGGADVTILQRSTEHRFNTPDVTADGFTFQSNARDIVSILGGGDRVVIRNSLFSPASSETGVRISSADDVVLEGNVFGGAGRGVLLRIGSAMGELVVRNSRFLSGSRGFEGGSNLDLTVRLENNIIEGGDTFGGVGLDSLSAVIVFNNIFVSNSRAFDVDDVSLVELSQNVFYGNDEAVRVCNALMSIENTIFQANSRAVDGCSSSRSVTLQYVMYTGGWLQAGPTYIRNQPIWNLDPQFVDPVNGDFNLASGSPAVGVGRGGFDLGAFGGDLGDDWLEPPGTPQTPPALQSITVTGDTQMSVGATVSYQAQGQHTDNFFSDLRRVGSWTSSNPAVLQSQGDGTFVALAAGTANVQLDYQGMTGSLAVTVEGSPDLSISKTADIDSVMPGGTIQYTLIVNNGGSTATGVVVTETYPQGVTFSTATPPPTTGDNLWQLGSLASGASQTIQVSVVVDASAMGSLINQVVVASDTADPTPSDNTDTASTVVERQADLAITKTDSAQTVAPGDAITYTITVTNLGPGDVSGATVTDLIPVELEGVSWSCSEAAAAANCNGSGDLVDSISLTVGGSLTYSLSGMVSDTATGDLSNSVSVAPPTGVNDPDATNNQATDTNAVEPLEPTCHVLDFTVAGSGNDPETIPAQSTSCSQQGEFLEGELIELAAAPADGWTVAGWSETDDDTRVSWTNTLTMPASDRTVGMTYVSCRAPRSLPSGYADGSPLTVTLEVEPETGVFVYAVEEMPPSGWAVSDINANGSFDASTQTVKWGPFFDSNPRSLTYRVTPPQGTEGSWRFEGLGSFDGENQAVCGDRQLDPATLHPADLSDNWEIEINEATGYGAAWRSGAAWERPPNPIPIAYVTRAGAIWVQGEVYHFDPNQDPPWIPGLPGSGLARMEGASQASASFDPPEYTPGVGVTVTVSVMPDVSVLVYAVEDSPPTGWTVSAISDGGVFDVANRRVKWGPFFDNAPRDLSYVATPPDDTMGSATFVGRASFDGADVPITGERIIDLACSYSVDPLSASFPASGGPGEIAVETLSGCSWEASSSNPWIGIDSGTTGTGAGTVSYSVSVNTSGLQRGGMLTVADQSISVMQDGVPCTFDISPQSGEIGPDGGILTVTVMAPEGCDWTATTAHPWIALTVAGGSGSGEVILTIAPNSTSLERSGTVTVAGQAFVVMQSGVPCTYAIGPTTADVGPDGETVTVTVTAPEGCVWTAMTSDSWIDSSAAAGSGNGEVVLTIGPNGSSLQRTGTVMIAGQTFVVLQDGVSCTYVIDPPSAEVGPDGEAVTVTVTAPEGCDWTATTGDAWIDVSVPSGSGNGEVVLTIESNTSSAQRTGAVMIAGEEFSLVQTGVPCTYDLSPAGADFPETGGSGTVAVSTLAGCVWQAESKAPWITIDSGDHGEGDGIVEYSVEANTGAPRSGSLTIASRTFPIDQEGPPCFTLQLGHTGSGEDPRPTPESSTGCEPGQYRAGEVIGLQAMPTPGWMVMEWSGAEDDRSRSTSATTTMPQADHSVLVSYRRAAVLLVDDDDNAPDVRSFYLEALAAAAPSLTVDLWNTENSDDEPDLASLTDYPLVVWFSGAERGGFAGPGATGEEALASYLDAGGCFLLSSQDYLYDRGGEGLDEPTVFMTDYLGLAAGTSDVAQMSVSGVGVVFGGVGTYTLDVPFLNLSDMLVPNAMAEVAFEGDLGVAAIQKEVDDYFSVFLGFPLEALPLPGRTEAMRAVLLRCVPQLAPFFVDGFETGDTSAWSTSVGGVR